MDAQAPSHPIVDNLRALIQPWKQKWDDLEQPKKVKVLQMAAAVSYFLFFCIMIVYTVSGVKKASISKSEVVVFMEANPEDLLALRYLFKRSDYHVAMIVLAMNSWNQNLLSQFSTVRSFLALIESEGAQGASATPVYYGDHLASRNAAFDATVDYTKVTQNVTSCSYTRVWPSYISQATETLYGVAYTLPMDPTTASMISSDDSPLYYQKPLADYLAQRRDKSVLAIILTTSTDFVTFYLSSTVLASKWSQVLLSGGTFGLRTNGTGNVQTVFPPNKRAEFNLFFDPQAANVVLQTIALTTNVVLVTLDASISALYSADQYSRLVTQVNKANSTMYFAAASLAAKRSLISPSTQDFSAPQDLVAIAVLSDTSLRKGSTMLSTPLEVVNGVRLSLDGTLQKSLAKNAPAVPVVVAVDNSAFWSHIANVEAVSYPH